MPANVRAAPAQASEGFHGINRRPRKPADPRSVFRSSRVATMAAHRVRRDPAGSLFLILFTDRLAKIQYSTKTSQAPRIRFAVRFIFIRLQDSSLQTKLAL